MVLGGFKMEFCYYKKYIYIYYIEIKGHNFMDIYKGKFRRCPLPKKLQMFSIK